MRFPHIGRHGAFPHVGGCIREQMGGYLSHNLRAVAHAHHAVSGNLTDYCGVKPPARKDRCYVLFSAPSHNCKHALLALTEHDLVGDHTLFPARHTAYVDINAALALVGRLNG